MSKDKAWRVTLARKPPGDWRVINRSGFTDWMDHQVVDFMPVSEYLQKRRAELRTDASPDALSVAGQFLTAREALVDFDSCGDYEAPVEALRQLLRAFDREAERDWLLEETEAHRLVAEAQRDRLLEAVLLHQCRLDLVALNGPRRDRDDVDNALYNTARAIEEGA